MLTFLKTLPGTLTGIAALIAAVAALMNALKPPQPSLSPSASQTASSTSSQPGAPPAHPAVESQPARPRVEPRPAKPVTNSSPARPIPPPSVPEPTVQTATTPPAPPMPVERVIGLQLQRVVVTHDGGTGSARWSFAVRANGVNVFHSVASLANTETRYDERGGKNIVEFGGQATDSISVREGSSVRLEVEGTRTSEPTRVTGVTEIAWDRVRRAAEGESQEVLVTSVASPPMKGSFIFTFGLRKAP